MMKRLVAILTGIVLITQLCFINGYAETPESVDCYITVTDITDVDNPFNVLANRIHLIVPYTDLTQISDYVFNPNGLDIDGSLIGEDKITYLHAIYALHKLTYGDNIDDIIAKFYVDGNGDITLFFGKIVSTILYQNNDGIFTKPQCIELNSGDELNICLYEYGHTQQVAIFDELYSVVQRNEDITLHLKEYLPEPEDSIPLSNMYLVDGDGVYLLDNQKHIATTDSNGEVTLNFSDGGLHRISIMPEIGYYMDTGQEVRETSKPEETRHVEVVSKAQTTTVTYDNSPEGWYNLLDEKADNYLDDKEAQSALLQYYDSIGEEPDPSVPVFMCSWDDEEETDEPLNSNSRATVKSSYAPKIVYYPVFTSDEPEPMISYTIPWANVYVDTQFVLNAQLAINKQDGYSSIYLDIKNSDTLEVDGHMPCVRVGRYNHLGEFLGWVGDRRYYYTDNQGNTYFVEGNTVTCTATNCRAGADITVLAYDRSVQTVQDLDDSTVVYVNQYSVETDNSNKTFTFPLRSFMSENDYEIVINKGNNAVSTQTVHLFERKAEWSDISYVLPKTIGQRTGLIAFQFTSYPEDIDDDPDNDNIYKVFCWEWDENDFNIEAPLVCPAITLTPPVARNNNNTR